MTRMKLELALLGEHPAKERLAADLDEMERLLDDYLDFARGQSSDAPQPTDLTVLIGEVVDQARRGLEAHQSLETGLPDALTAPAQPVPIRRCLANLIDNGVRHAQRVRVHASALPDAVEICVDDDGPGIAEEDRETAFKPFSGVGGREPEGGSGLGLAIARDIARAHGGDLTLGRSPIGGLSCRLRLPV
jgi:two-component system osmolarity sensor histidine kinase EnvZ